MQTAELEQVVRVLSRHVSAINARVLLERGARVLSDPPRVHHDEWPVFVIALRNAARLFLSEDQTAALLAEIEGATMTRNNSTATPLARMQLAPATPDGPGDRPATTPGAGLRIVIGSATRAADGGRQGGDALIVRESAGRTLFGIVDALGQGALARYAATEAERYLAEAPLDGGLLPVMDGLSGALRGTKGASATLCLFDGGKLWAAAVGNVELRCVGCRMPSVGAPQHRGASVRRPRMWSLWLEAHARIVLFSEGLSRVVDPVTTRQLPPAEAAQQMLAEHGGINVDATVLVADVGT